MVLVQELMLFIGGTQLNRSLTKGFKRQKLFGLGFSHLPHLSQLMSCGILGPLVSKRFN